MIDLGEKQTADRFKLLCVLAHPDDETLGCGGLIVWSVAHGIDVYLICATRGERGWAGRDEDNPGLEELGRIREAELREAAQVLGVHEVTLLDYLDGDLDRADSVEAIGQIAHHVRRIRPQVVVTFDCFGAYGHPDHIAISQFTHAALVCAADRSYRDPGDQPPYRVAKLYWQVDTQDLADQFSALMGGPLSMSIDGETRVWTPFPEWSITTRLDATTYSQTVRRAVQCHRSQLPTLPDMDQFSAEQHQLFWGQPTLYRVYSLVDAGRGVEHDLFAGLR